MSRNPIRLSFNSLDVLPDDIQRPLYQPKLLREGIVHIGVGGFHRSHQAYYTDALMNQGKAADWAVCGAGLLPGDRRARDFLASQDFLYTLVELGDEPNTEVRVIGSIRNMLLAEEDPEALIAKLASPEIRIVSLTITEGGYCMDDSTGKFRTELPEIAYDLNHPDAPRTVFGFLAAALQRRREAGVGAFTVVSCDNVPHNGAVARKSLLAFATLAESNYGVGLADWITEHATFPNSMVDRITPITSEAHRRELLETHGIEDVWPVVCEPFIQWVLEDNFCAGRPAWEDVGVQFTSDVTPYEHMKIRLLNGSHTSLTYLGFLRGYRFVHETMADPLFLKFIRSYMDEDVTWQLGAVPGVDLETYKDTLIRRFSNTVIADQLERVCLDGSAKFPKFIVPIIEGLIRTGKQLDRAALVVASWVLYLRGVDEDGVSYAVVDPRAGYCMALAKDDDGLSKRVLGAKDIFGNVLPASTEFVSAFERQFNLLCTYGVEATLRALVVP